ncbi:HPr kinase/phosphorylase [hydrothermal vent metagenome]|uniref:HPr kinase/phosphorylase n=1 Tax=hydrothermal vent metagenome TaxID=652676 RepID=A0A3B1BZ03_9ZZZZ
MVNKLTVQDVFDSHQQPLELSWLSQIHQTRQSILDETRPTQPGPAPNLVGYLNLIRPNRIQVLGATETRYLSELEADICEDTLRQLFDARPALIIFACSTQPRDALRHWATNTFTPMLGSPLTTRRVIDVLDFHLNSTLSKKQIIHGVFMEVLGLGILLVGPSGVGKSELALELLTRGHRLIADDAPEFFQATPDTVHGRCPDLLEDFIEVRGLGILNVRAMFGDNAILSDKRLSLIIRLEHTDTQFSSPLERLDCTQRHIRVLDMDIPEVVLPLGPGRDLAIIIETAVRNHALHLRGYNSAQDFIKRQKELINKTSS